MNVTLSEKAVFDNLNWYERLCRKFTMQFLAGIEHGEITLIEDGQRYQFGDSQSTLKASITVLEPAFYQKLVLSGSVGAGEADINGSW